MSSFSFIVFQVAILGLVTLVGIAFTYALPKPGQKHKARSAHFARLFLFCLWLGHSALTLRHIGLDIVYVAFYGPCMLAGAYLMFMTIIKRYGHALRKRSLWFIIGHLLFVEVASLYLYTLTPQDWPRDILMLVSCTIPLLLSLVRIRHYLREGNQGDRVLYIVIVITLVITCVETPLYLFGAGADEKEQTVYGFGLVLIMMLVFMLGFAASVMHSLVGRLHTQVYTDPLTKAKNRHYFYDVAPKLDAHARRHGERLTVVVCDIDHFKAINDKYGHVAGDKALRQFARILQNELRTEDTLIRMGGEEFLVLSVNISLSQARQLAERLRLAVSETPVRFHEQYVNLTASFGVVEIQQAKDIFASIREADDALYRAKSLGRNQVITVA